MTAELLMQTNRLLAAHYSGRRLCLFFDYDGTLVPITERPELARLVPATRQRLERLARLPAVSVGILSGRALDDLQRMVGLPGLYYAGTSGLELDLAGNRLIHPRASDVQALLREVTQLVQGMVTNYPGAWVECKPLGLTLHYRGVNPDQIGKLCIEASQVLQRWAKDLRILDGPMAIEATLALGWTKGTAVQTFLKCLDLAAALLYAGDGANDGDALEVTVARGGVAVGIGSESPAAAHHRLPDPLALIHLIDYVLEQLDPWPVACHQRNKPVLSISERMAST
ncbi:MAG TPA: trehalose-phosphatase [Gemmataceae bacterium]|jgi:trehalose-phosphatase